MTISIITIVYNGEKLLEGTIKSVIGQTFFQNVEYIIVDGGSKDGTVGIIKQYEKQVSQWVSEPDKGLYDAMNKGLRRAKGDFVLFLNCGDELTDDKVLETVFLKAEKDTDVLFGETYLVDDNRKKLGTRSALTTQKLPEVLTWKSMRYGMVVCHQSFIVRRTIAPFYMLDNLAADIDWVMVALKRARKITPTKIVIADYLVGGVSVQKHKQSLKDRFYVLSHHFGLVPTVFAHIWIVLRGIIDKFFGVSTT